MSFPYDHKKVTRTCDYCKCLLRKADMYIPIGSQYKKLCPKCWYAWGRGEIADVGDKTS